MIVLIKPRSISNVSHAGSKTRSVGQTMEKLCEHDTGHIMQPIIMKICQNACLGEILVKF